MGAITKRVVDGVAWLELDVADDPVNKITKPIREELRESLESLCVDEEVQAAYEANPKEFDRPAQVRASHIFIKNRARAAKVLEQAKEGDRVGFKQLARNESEDEKTKAHGVCLRFFTAEAEEGPAPVRKAAFSLQKVGSVYPDLIADGEGFHIIMLTGKRAALERTYEQAKRAIRHKLTRERKEAAMKALTTRLHEEVEVEVDYDALEEVRIDSSDLPTAP